MQILLDKDLLSYCRLPSSGLFLYRVNLCVGIIVSKFSWFFFRSRYGWPMVSMDGNKRDSDDEWKVYSFENCLTKWFPSAFAVSL